MPTGGGRAKEPCGDEGRGLAARDEARAGGKSLISAAWGGVMMITAAAGGLFILGDWRSHRRVLPGAVHSER